MVGGRCGLEVFLSMTDEDITTGGLSGRELLSTTPLDITGRDDGVGPGTADIGNEGESTIIDMGLPLGRYMGSISAGRLNFGVDDSATTTGLTDRGDDRKLGGSNSGSLGDEREAVVSGVGESLSGDCGILGACEREALKRDILGF